MEKSILLQKYLHGELSEAEEEEFLNYLESDEEFSQEVKVHSLMHANRAKELEKYLFDSQSTIPKESTHSRSTLFKIIRNVAAMVLLAAISYFSFSTLSNQETPFLVEDLYAEPFISPGLKLSSSSEEDIWQKAIVLYSDRQYALAETEILKIGNISTEQNLYLGLSKMYKETPDFQGAISIFKEIKDQANNLNKDVTMWYLAIAYLKSGQKNLAKPLLESMASGDHYKKKEAKQVLKHFDKI